MDHARKILENLRVSLFDASSVRVDASSGSEFGTALASDTRTLTNKQFARTPC
jgi:hypothetical protein